MSAISVDQRRLAFPFGKTFVLSTFRAFVIARTFAISGSFATN